MYFYQKSNENATRFVAVTLIVLTTIYIVFSSAKVRLTEAATGGFLYKNEKFNIHRKKPTLETLF